MSLIAPYELPHVLPSFLPQVLSYWTGLRRGQAEIPYADDVSLAALSEHEDDLILIDVFEKPLRCRFGLVGANITKAYGSEVAGFFLDELDSQTPLDLIHSQASAAVELRKPNFYLGEKYARLMLPAWADGHISAILCAIAVAR